jgi:hypothetical protein
MNSKTFRAGVILRRWKLLTTLITLLAIPATAPAQPSGAAPDGQRGRSADVGAPPTKPLEQQVTELNAKVAQLEAALHQRHKAGAGSAAMGGMQGGQTQNNGGMGGMGRGKQDMGMGQMKGMSGAQPGGQMGMMGMDGMPMMDEMGMGGMGPMKAGGAGGAGMMMGMDQEMMGMMGMPPGGQMGGKMSMPSALPGFPGASHLYHVGATGFFLDHDEHISPTTAQRTSLNQIKEKALLDKSSLQRKIDEAKQQLWTLTASDQPDAKKIEEKVREIERLRSDQRLNVIRAVGDAAKVLTDEQRQALLSGSPAMPPEPADPHAGHKHGEKPAP